MPGQMINTCCWSLSFPSNFISGSITFCLWCCSVVCLCSHWLINQLLRNQVSRPATTAPQVERLLDSVDAVIYLLDYTKLKTADEAEVLQRLKEINPQLMARLSQRLFFVVNKADMIETSEGLDAEATKQYVANLITHQMQDESFQLKPEQVWPKSCITPSSRLYLCTSETSAPAPLGLSCNVINMHAHRLSRA